MSMPLAFPYSSPYLTNPPLTTRERILIGVLRQIEEHDKGGVIAAIARRAIAETVGT